MRWQSYPHTSRISRRIHFGNVSPVSRGWSAGLALAAVIAAAVVIFDAPSPLRPLAVLIFLGFGPGLGLIGLIGIRDLTQRLVLSIGISLALDTLVAGLSLYAGLWSPLGVLLVLVAVTLVGAALQFWATSQASGWTVPYPMPDWGGTAAHPGRGVMVAPVAAAGAVARLPRRRLRPNPGWIVIPITLLLVLAGGLVASTQPRLVLPLIALAVVLMLITMKERSETLFLGSLGILILGYLIAGNGFASVRFSSLHLADIVFLLGLAAVVIGHLRIRLTAVEVSLILFIMLGVMHTAPLLRTDGINAIRDASLWYYAPFALLVSWFMTEHRLRVVLGGIRLILPILLMWLALLPFAAQAVPSMPSFPGAMEQIISIPARSEQAVVLVGLAAFVASGLYAYKNDRWQGIGSTLWILLLLPAFIIAVSDRGGMVACLVGLACLMMLTPSRGRLRPAVFGALAVAVLVIWNPSFGTQQLMIDDSSIVSHDTVDAHELPPAKQWRLQEWNNFKDDTSAIQDIWTGEGFGSRLVDHAEGQSADPGSTGSPQNIYMIVLERVGVPGLTIWIVMQLAFANQMIRAYRTSRSRGERFWIKLYAWILPVWLTALVWAGFDAYLESPEGAIPFWCLFGLGLGALRLQEKGRFPDSIGYQSHAEDGNINPARR